MSNSSEGRKKAWETRRAKYGQTGYSPGAYHSQCSKCKRMEELIIKLYLDGVLSEGQASAATNLDRVTLRAKADAKENTHE